MRGLRKAADVIDRQRLPAELRMAFVDFDLLQQQADRFGRTGDGIGAVPRPRRMAGRALHRHEHVDTAAVAERDLQSGPAQHRHVGSYARALDNAPDRIVLAGLAREAAGEDELALDRGLTGDHDFHRVQHGRESGLLLARSLAHHAFPGQAVCRAVDHVAGVGVGHGRGGLVHGVADEHQRLVGRLRAVGRD